MMHPMTYRIAAIRIEEMQQQACRARLARAARRPRRRK